MYSLTVVQHEKTILRKRFRSAVAALAAKGRLVAKFPDAIVQVAEASPPRNLQPPTSREAGG